VLPTTPTVSISRVVYRPARGSAEHTGTDGPTPVLLPALAPEHSPTILDASRSSLPLEPFPSHDMTCDATAPMPHHIPNLPTFIPNSTRRCSAEHHPQLTNAADLFAEWSSPPLITQHSSTTRAKKRKRDSLKTDDVFW
jgi:hypothetical protein